jgi:hypothetical protein
VLDLERISKHAGAHMTPLKTLGWCLMAGQRRQGTAKGECVHACKTPKSALSVRHRARPATDIDSAYRQHLACLPTAVRPRSAVALVCWWKCAPAWRWPRRATRAAVDVGKVRDAAAHLAPARARSRQPLLQARATYLRQRGQHVCWLLSAAAGRNGGVANATLVSGEKRQSTSAKTHARRAPKTRARPTTVAAHLPRCASVLRWRARRAGALMRARRNTQRRERIARRERTHPRAHSRSQHARPPHAATHVSHTNFQRLLPRRGADEEGCMRMMA